MDLRQIRHFIAVAETGSFTKAAQRVDLSQPALSASIAKMESEYQVKLLDRRNARVVPTAAGRRLLERGSAIVLMCNSVMYQLKSADVSRPLRVGVLSTFSATPTYSLVNVFSRSMPDTQVELSDGTKEILLKRLRDRRLDAVIATIDDPDPNFETMHLLKENFVLAVAADHRFAREKFINLTDLDGETFVVRAGCDITERALSLLSELNVRLHVAYRASYNSRALSLVSAGVGVAILPELFDSDGVSKIEIVDVDFSRNIGIYWNSDVDNRRLDHFILAASMHSWR